MSIRVLERLPSPTEFNELRVSIGWSLRDPGVVARGLAQSLFSVCALDGDRIVGHARVVGDGALYFYLQDVMVLPAYQRRGIGSIMMDAVFAYLQRSVPSESFVGLMAAEGASEFYRRYGFAERPSGRPGMQRWWQAHA